MNLQTSVFTLAATPPPSAPQAWRRWAGKPTIITAWLALALAIISPVTGIGISMCWMRDTGIPCPGCGLTRSMSCALRGMFPESWAYHPFGPLLLAFFILVAISSLMPDRWRTAWASRLQTHLRLLNIIFAGFVAAFVSFGFARAILQLSGVCWFGV